MNGMGKGLLLPFALVALILVPPGLRAEHKTITRVDDPVVVESSDFDVLFGAPIENLALMALRRDSWEPVPFQIDQKKPDGTYAFTHGPEASKDPDPNLDANDDLVFMVKDTGDRAGTDQMPEKAGAAIELTITDPKNGHRRSIGRRRGRRSDRTVSPTQPRRLGFRRRGVPRLLRSGRWSRGR